jgi:hypothetical protein
MTEDKSLENNTNKKLADIPELNVPQYTKREFSYELAERSFKLFVAELNLLGSPVGAEDRRPQEIRAMFEKLFKLDQTSGLAKEQRVELRLRINAWTVAYTQRDSVLTFNWHMQIESLLNPNNPLHNELSAKMSDAIENPYGETFGQLTQMAFEVMQIVKRVLNEE